MSGDRNPKSKIQNPKALTLRTRGEGREERGERRRRAGKTVVSGQWSVVSPIPNPQSLIPNPSRRGILLLIVLALLAMFGLVAVTFVVLTGQAQRSAKSIEHWQEGDQPTTDPAVAKNLLQQAAMQVFRGSSGTVSVMGARSLLEDMYGDNWVQRHGQCHRPGRRTTWSISAFMPVHPALQRPNSHRRGVRVVVTGPTDQPLYRPQYANRRPSFPAHRPISSYGVPFDGPPQRKRRNRPIRHQRRALQRDGVWLYAASGHSTLSPVRPTRTVGIATGTLPVALFPNCRFRSTGTEIRPAGPISDYTAADFQHMLLAAQVFNTTTNTVQTLPSLHRPALINYWINNQAAINWNGLWAANPDLCRAISIRPIGP